MRHTVQQIFVVLSLSPLSFMSCCVCGVCVVRVCGLFYSITVSVDVVALSVPFRSFSFGAVSAWDCVGCFRDACQAGCLSIPLSVLSGWMRV
uniref:Secreted protein n=1 Tax=Vitrella brassicaformis TaxID=1169539 RepID=A0A7S1JXX3_9ALVE